MPFIINCLFRLFAVVFFASVIIGCHNLSTTSQNDRKNKAYIDSLIDISKQLTDNGDFVNSKIKIKEAYSFSEKNDILYGKINSCYLLCNAFYGQEIADSSSFYGEKAISYYDNSEEENNEELKKIVALVYTRLAILYVETGNYGISYRYIFESENLVNGITDAEFMLEHNGRLAHTYYFLGLFKEAQKYYNNKLALLRLNVTEYSGAMYEQGIYRDLGLTFFNLKDYNKAIVYYDSALSKLSPKPNLTDLEAKSYQIAIGIINGNKGQAYAAQKKYKEAIVELNSNIKINSKVGYDNIDATSSLIALANVYLEQNDFEKFKATISKTDSLYNARATNVYYNRMIKIKALAYEKLNDNEKGYALLKKFIAWNDSSTSSFIKNNLRFKLNKFDTEKRNKIVDNLNKETKETKRRFYLILALATLLVIIAILSIFSVYSYRKSDNKLRRLYKQLAQNQSALENSNLDMQKLVIEKNNILGIVAHDLKSPLSSIKGLTMLLDAELNSKKIIDEDIARFIDYIKVSINHMNSVTDDILEMSTLESSQTPLVMIETNVNQLINNIVMLFGLKAKEKFITIVTEYSGNILFKLNEKKIERAISNLVNNAIKFSNAGSKIIIKALLENENLIIQIIDQGIGIDEKNFESIFDRFTRSKNIGTAGEKPVGLGLSIVKQIVEKHGGTIHFTSEKNVGTTFIVTIPKTV